MARPINILPSTLLVFLGAWVRTILYHPKASVEVKIYHYTPATNPCANLSNLGKSYDMDSPYYIGAFSNVLLRCLIYNLTIYFMQQNVHSRLLRQSLILLQSGTGLKLKLLSCGAVWLVSLISGSISVASMVMNDYFDYVSGADVVNAPDKVI